MHRDTTTIVIVPGLRGYVADHWQTLLAATLPQARIVESYERSKPDLDGRVADLQRVVEDAGGPVTIVAHSAGVLTTVHWAQRHRAPVAGALLATPPDLAQELPGEYPRLAELAAAGWLPIPRVVLPFPSIVAASSTDALGDPDRIRALADAWGSHVVDVGPVGHLNPAAGYGEWPAALGLLDELRDIAPTSRTVW